MQVSYSVSQVLYLCLKKEKRKPGNEARRSPIQDTEIFGTCSHVRNGLEMFSNRILFTTIDRLARSIKTVNNPSVN